MIHFLNAKNICPAKICCQLIEMYGKVNERDKCVEIVLIIRRKENKRAWRTRQNNCKNLGIRWKELDYFSYSLNLASSDFHFFLKGIFERKMHADRRQFTKLSIDW